MLCDVDVSGTFGLPLAAIATSSIVVAERRNVLWHTAMWQLGTAESSNPDVPNMHTLMGLTYASGVTR